MTAPALILLPAVDVAEGQAVRLTQGAAGTETSYGDPVDAANEWVEQGAEWIHLVDLDAAFGRGNNHELLKRVVANNLPLNIIRKKTTRIIATQSKRRLSQVVSTE